MNSRMISNVIQRQAKSTQVGYAEESNDASWQLPSFDGKNALEDRCRRSIALQNKSPNFSKGSFASHMANDNGLLSCVQTA
jgi:hypothetical protein